MKDAHLLHALVRHIRESIRKTYGMNERDRAMDSNPLIIVKDEETSEKARETVGKWIGLSGTLPLSSCHGGTMAVFAIERSHA